jgi:MFS family permease
VYGAIAGGGGLVGLLLGGLLTEYLDWRWCLYVNLLFAAIAVPRCSASSCSSPAWLTRIGVHSGYASSVLGPLLVAGAGIGLAMPSSMNTGTFGVAPGDAGVASATLNVGQQIGGSIGTALLNTVATSAAATYLTSHLSPAIAASPQSRAALQAAAAVHGYTTAFWWTAGMFAAGAVVCGTLLRRGPLAGQAQRAPADVRAQRHEPAAPLARP